MNTRLFTEKKGTENKQNDQDKLRIRQNRTPRLSNRELHFITTSSARPQGLWTVRDYGSVAARNASQSFGI